MAIDEPGAEVSRAQQEIPATDTPPSTVACCEHDDETTREHCALDGRPVCAHCRRKVNDKTVCTKCFDQVMAELQNEQADPARMPMAVLGGVVAALIAGGLWAVIAVASKLEVGYVAVGVGWLAAQGVLLGSGRKKGKSLQLVSVSCAILGLLAGKYFIMIHTLQRLVAERQGAEAAAHISYLSTTGLRAFSELLPQLVSPFDLLWLLLAVGIANRALKPRLVMMR